jgi:hypothetical protein
MIAIRTMVVVLAVASPTLFASHAALQPKATGGPVRPVPKNQFELLNEQASAARGNSESEIGKLVDRIFDRFAGVPIPSGGSIRKRVYDAELAFRHQQHPPITEGQLVRAINGAVGSISAPPWARTNLDQLHIIREFMHPMLPQLVGTTPSGKGPFGISEKMSPAEAVFLCFSLMNGKVWDQDYRMPPEEWVQRVRIAKVFQNEQGRLPVGSRVPSKPD